MFFKKKVEKKVEAKAKPKTKAKDLNVRSSDRKDSKELIHKALAQADSLEKAATKAKSAKSLARLEGLAGLVGLAYLLDLTKP